MQTLPISFLVLVLAAAATTQSQTDTNKIRKAADAAVGSSDWKTAIASFRQLVEADPKDGNAWRMLGYALHSNGDLDQALEAHIRATEFKEQAPVASYNAACVYALRGKKAEALDWLAKAANAGFNLADHMEGDTDMDSLRNEPRYKELVAQIEKNAATPTVQVFGGASERQLTRVVAFAGRKSIGGASISYGRPQWNAKYDEMIDQAKYENHRWRLGRDEWTTLDTSVGLKLGDKDLEPGVYYLTLERRGKDFVLSALDPASVHKHTIDPYLAHLTKGGTEIVLEHETVSEVSDKLEIQLAKNPGKTAAGNLVVRFGPHKLTAPFALQLKSAQ